MPDLEPDSLIRFPSITVLKASAGSGKTYPLTERYAQFLLSSRVPKNDLFLRKAREGSPPPRSSTRLQTCLRRSPG
jgi:hypothetical protein